MNIPNRLILSFVLLIGLLGISSVANAAPTCNPTVSAQQRGVGTPGNYTDQACFQGYPCHTGHSCDGYTESVCAPGTYQSRTQRSGCDLAPAGTYVTDGLNLNFAPKGTYACGPGNQYAGTTCMGAGSPTSCPQYTYADVVGLSACKTAPVGYLPPADPTLSAIPASPGFYAPGTMPPTNLACPANTYSSRSGMSRIADCTACPAGSLSNAGSSYCQNDFGNGYYCSFTWTGSAYQTGVCTHVSPGFYTSFMSNSQAACPANSSALASGSGCTANPGYFLTYDNSATRVCNVNNCNLSPVHIIANQAAAGYYAAAGSSTQFACPAHSSSLAGASTCTSNAGYFCTVGPATVSSPPAPVVVNTGPVTCTQATVGNYATAGATAQTPCPAHSTSTAGASACSASPGYYLNNGVLTQADAGSYAPGNTSSQTLCPAHSTSTAGASACSASPGYYLNNGVLTQATAGYYASGNTTSQTPCAAGTFLGSAGGTSALSCTTCPAHSTSSAGASACSASPGYFLNGGVISQADAGSYAPGNTTYQTACPAGTYSTAYAATSSSTCTPCAAGSWSSIQGLNRACTLADVGYYVIGTGATSQTACPLGTCTPSNGSTTRSQCSKNSCGGD